MKRPSQPTGDLSATQRLVRVVTHPTQIIEPLTRRALRQPPRPHLDRSGFLLLVAGFGVGAGLLVGFLGVLVQLPQVFLVGALLLSGGMASASLEGLLDLQDDRLLEKIRKVTGR